MRAAMSVDRHESSQASARRAAASPIEMIVPTSESWVAESGEVLRQSQLTAPTMLTLLCLSFLSSSLASCGVIISRYRQALGLSQLSLRGTFVVSLIAFQALLVVITESLSLMHHLTQALS